MKSLSSGHPLRIDSISTKMVIDFFSKVSEYFILEKNEIDFGKVILFDGWTCDWTAGDELFPAYKAPSTWIYAISFLIGQCSFWIGQSDKRIACWSTNWPEAQSYFWLNQFAPIQRRLQDEKEKWNAQISFLVRCFLQNEDSVGYICFKTSIIYKLCMDHN